VLIGYRRRKIGRLLLDATIERAREFGLQKIELEVFSSNEAAVGLYRSFGFYEEGRKRRGRFVDGNYDDILMMALELKMPNQLPDSTSPAITPSAKTGCAPSVIADH
jgi:ribosomal protein S18 acetylase RimI-like enzyme